MKYKLAILGFSKDLDSDLLSKVRETTRDFRERYIKTLQIFGSIDRVEEVIKEFIKRCGADYQVDYVTCNAASENILIKIILNPYSDYSIWVNFLFYPAIEDELEDDANKLNGLLSGEDISSPLKENSSTDNTELEKAKAHMYTFYNEEILDCETWDEMRKLVYKCFPALEPYLADELAEDLMQYNYAKNAEDFENESDCYEDDCYDEDHSMSFDDEDSPYFLGGGKGW